MTFLNPLALFGLLAAAIPILLHLFNLRKLRTIEFSTLTFLKELQKTRIRRLKLRQILLLILRTLLIALIALAFSRPSVKGTFAGSIGSHAKTSAVIIIDDSYSMTSSDAHGELLRQAKQSAKDLLQLFADGDEIFLLRLSALARQTPGDEAGTRDVALLRSRIDEIKPSAIRQPLELALRFAARLLTGSSNFNKEIYLISDFQEGVVSGDVEGTTSRESLFPPETQFFFAPLGNRVLENVGIESLTIPSTIFERGKLFTLQARFGNFSAKDIQDRVVSVFLNGTRVAERSVDIQKHSTASLDFSLVADAVGYIEGFVELDHDDVEYDNRRHFTIHIPDQIRVLLVGTRENTRFPLLALSTRASTAASTLLIEEVRPERLSSLEIKRSHAIILCTSEGFSSAQLSELAAFVRSGRGLLLFPGLQIAPAAFNAQFASGLGAPTLAALDKPASPVAETKTFLEFDRAELKHPLFEGIFEPGGSRTPEENRASGPTSGRTLESPRIGTSARFSADARSNTVITMTNGAPFLIEQRAGAGRLLIFAVTSTNDWSDFPSRGLFVPLLHGSVRYLAGQQSLSEELVPGSEVTLRTSDGASGPWSIRTPLQLDIALAPSQQLFQQLFRFGGTDEPGVYTLRANETSLQKFVVNLDSRESQILRARDEQVENMMQKMGVQKSAIHEASDPDDVKRTVLESRFGVELWKYFLVIALIIAVIELLVARTSKQETTPVSQHD